MKLLPTSRFAVALPSRVSCTVVIVGAVLFGGSRGTQDAIANGDTRTISIYHTHTKETVTVTFRRNGQYDERGLEQLNWALRDWRRDEATRMDPRLFDIVWAVHREVGSSEPIHIVSAYRSPETNSMLRRRSSGVAENSQHTRGKAIDFFLPDVPIERVRAVGMRLQYGGVGYYPTSYNPFVHLDVGSVRAWPRMTRDQLVRLFPDGKTVHLPPDGKPLPGYEEARAEVLARGGTVAGVSAYASADPAPGRRGQRSFWARLFGGEDDEDLQEMRNARNGGRGSQRVQVASAAPGQDESPASALTAYNAVREAQGRPSPAGPMPDPLARVRKPEAVAAPAPAAPAPAPVRTAALGMDTRDVFQAAIPPIPPRRPDEVVATGTLAFAPLPPARPDFASSTTTAPAPSAPEKPAAALVAVAHPLPPARPTQGIQVAAIGPISVPSAVAVPAVPPLPKQQREELRALFGRVLMVQATPAREPRTAVAKVRPDKTFPAGLLASGTTLALRFSTKAPELATDRFAGPAVKALPVLR